MPTVETSADSLVAAVSTHRPFVATWQAPPEASPGGLPPVPFSGSEDLTVWLDVRHASFKATGYEIGEAECANHDPVTNATLHLESSSGRLHESVLGELAAQPQELLFQGRVASLDGSARSYNPVVAAHDERSILFHLTMGADGTPRSLELTMEVDHAESTYSYTFLRSD